MDEYVNLFYNMFVNDIFGSRVLFGIGILFLYAYMAFKLRMGFDAFGITFIALVFVLSALTIFPQWLIAPMIIVLGLIIAFGLLRVKNR
jgi:hypothetical protein